MAIRVVHYLNQFFAGVGGEDRADVGPDVRDGPVGPGARLNQILGDDGTVVGTVFCGDNHMVTHTEQAVADVAELISRFEPDVVVAGPSFGSGRYGLACAHVCVAAQAQLRVPSVTGMFPEAPGAAFRGEVVIVPTSETAAGMGAALDALARLALKLGRGEELGPPEIDGYLPRGLRKNELAPTRAADRAVSMLLQKIGGEEFSSEWPAPRYERISPPDPLAHDVTVPLVALVSEGGVVPAGNPDRIPGAWATHWAKYDISSVDDLAADAFESVHGGIDTSRANEDPDRLIPVDAARDLERAGAVRLVDTLYSTVGNMGSTEMMQRLGAEMAAELRDAGVNAVIVGGT